MEKKIVLVKPYSAYERDKTPAENADLTRVEKGSPMGEYLRRFWQPVALSEELGELPTAVRMFGEDLVLFRARNGKPGLLEKHCSHRGTSLEFGICEENGLRCCYHGWLFGVDGQILETPGDPPDSQLRFNVCHGAYPLHEYRGIIFGYFGPPADKPEFPVYDTYDIPGDRLVPYCITYPCNWLQVHENVMDPAHAVFLHTRISFTQFAEAWGELPEMDFVPTPTGMIYVTSRRWEDKVWVRSNDIVLPNLAQVGHIWEDGLTPKEFARVAITRWTTPIDDHTCRIIGWRHMHPDADPRGLADESLCGVETVDFFGQNGERPYADRQRMPGDYDAQISQRPIAVHAMENLTRCDRGVAMLRQLLRRESRKIANGEAPAISPLRANGATPTYAHDTVVSIPPADTDDAACVREIGKAITAIVVKGDHHEQADRPEQVRERIRAYAAEQASTATSE
ncbi:aromatic ring-hydroxylating dioxygenase subunit alpha [Bordetella bronchiseptica]|uniref:Iron-sulphur protein n=3 Tax=Bordetella bronchiseptica TaxID=518 RepID=A0A0H3LZ56_BORBR|nr:aromatic ring-hydroxylating dioxygenase subunit alpha [Bordetella bronchiseptica]KAK61173.1 Rieske [2Fe-2S] domain protein [Bordetella bronchiseptica 980-2]SHS69091.1 Rieske (2Fe-2S) domain-containing protein [Mycobacteroides abscessus subsp. abscessus]AMG90284.1 aromatic ring-hydroxylating dioxygenase subunit alpha [Bordetella bronchiseptica]AWP76794.1 (Fe-S)-binding protein [Bordetella bronchiseptica]AWP87319.1 (Fe-S)-binding protein [Bordetella bronchiseptica]